MVMDGCHLHTVISSFPEIFVEGPLARSMLVSYSAMGCRAHCASLRLCAFKCCEIKAKQRREEGAEALHAWQRMGIEALLR